MLKGKNIVLGVTGSIAAYKTANLASMLVKLHANVYVIMTRNACNFINPIVFESLTGNKCMVDTFDRNFQFNIAHVSLASKADLCMIAPASANIIGKIAGGIADDMLSTTVMAMECPVYISPAMNTHMFENAIVQDNLKKLASFGYHIIDPASGHLACGTSGAGKMPEPQDLLQYLLYECAFPKDFAGKKILVTAGPTREAVDPVRFLSNYSTGKMGYALARIAAFRGADVTLVSGPVSLTPPPFVTTVPVTSAREMFDAVTSRAEASDIIIKAAAVADYRPAAPASEKIKKQAGGDDLNLRLKRTDDILAWLGAHRRDGQFLCGFSMETQNLLENSRAKLQKKNLDMIVANSLRTAGAGFGGDTNIVTLITPADETALPLLSKEETAVKILDRIAKALGLLA